MIRFTNTMSGLKEEFVPIKDNTVRMYSCGPTVYNVPHIGNFRNFCFVDLLRRYLKFRGYDLVHVMNLTDVDDKSIRDAQKAGVPLKEFTQEYIDAFFKDIETLGIEQVEYYPRATDHVPGMIELVQKLQEKGLTYTRDGSTYFAISKFRDYGKLSKLDKRTIQVGVSVDADEYTKDDARDFVLWKARREGEPFWESPFGEGRPGWHLECTVMSSKYLGVPFDIHTGGIDLIFPHHENEIAQSEGAYDTMFVKYWLHNDYLMLESEKMSKSKGNVTTLQQLLDEGYDARVIRLLLLSTHYRKQLNFTRQGLTAAEETLKRIWDFMDRLEEPAPSENDNENITQLVRKTQTDFTSAMDDDLNISEAMGAVHTMVREVNTAINQGTISSGNMHEVKTFMNMIDGVLNLLHREKGSLADEVEKLIAEREQAREQKNFKRADEIRDQLKSQGIVLEDTAHGTRWKKE